MRYSPQQDTWTQMASIPFPSTDPTDAPDGAGIADHTVVAVGGFIYAIGGTNGTAALRSTWRFHPQSNKWKQMASMHIARCYVAAAVVDGKIFAVGGSKTPAGPGGPGGGPGALSSMEVYDPTNDQWTMSKAEMNIARTTHTVVVASGVLYAIGGDDGGGAPTFFDTAERKIVMFLPCLPSNCSHLATS